MFYSRRLLFLHVYFSVVYFIFCDIATFPFSLNLPSPYVILLYIIYYRFLLTTPHPIFSRLFCLPSSLSVIFFLAAYLSHRSIHIGIRFLIIIMCHRRPRRSSSDTWHMHFLHRRQHFSSVGVNKN